MLPSNNYYNPLIIDSSHYAPQVLTIGVPSTFLEPQRLYTDAEVVAAPHFKLISNFLKTDGDSFLYRAFTRLEVKAEKKESEIGESLKILLNPKDDRKDFDKIQLSHISCEVAGRDCIKFIAKFDRTDIDKIGPVSHAFIPGSDQWAAQFVRVKIVDDQNSPDKVIIKIPLYYDIKKLNMFPLESTFFLISRDNKSCASFPIDTSIALGIWNRQRLNLLFRSVHDYAPENIFIIGKPQSGKTTLCNSIINVIHGHSKGFKNLNFDEYIFPGQPNPMINYPSTLVNLMDTMSMLADSSSNLEKSFDYLNKRNIAANTVCIMLSVEDLNDEVEVKRAVELSQKAAELGAVPILVVTKIDLYNENLETEHQACQKLDEQLTALKKQNFAHIVPVSLYRREVHTERLDFIDQAIVNILYISRFSKKELPIF